MAAKQQESVFRFRVDGSDVLYQIDVEELTFGEIAAIETEFDCAWNDVPFTSTRFTLAILKLALGRAGASLDAAELTPADVEFVEADRPTKKAATSGGQK